MSFFRYFLISSDGIKIPARYEAGRYTLDIDEKRVCFLTDYILAGRLDWAVWDKLYRRELIEKYNLRFADNNIIFAEDLCFCLCYCIHAVNILSVDEFLYNYIQRPHSIMAEQSVRLNAGRMNELAKQFWFFVNRYTDCDAVKERFPLIYFMIMDNVLTRARNTMTVSSFEFRKRVYADVCDRAFMRLWTGRFLKMKKELYTIYPESTAALKISFAAFLYDGNYILFRLRNKRALFFEKQKSKRKK